MKRHFTFIEPLDRRVLLTAILPGDANADGIVDGDDYAKIDAGYSAQLQAYPNGDFNSDGRIDADDYWLIDSSNGRTNQDVTGPNGTLANVGDTTITVSGTVFEFKNVTGRITISANNVTIRNVRVTAPNTAYAVKQNSGYTGLLMEDCEITGPAVDTGIVWYNGTIRRTEIHHVGGDALKPRGPALIEGNWIHHLGMEAGSHADGIQFYTSDNSAIANVTVRGNYFDMPHSRKNNVIVLPQYEGFGSNACVFTSCPTPGFVAENNWFNGGNYCVGGAGMYRNNFFGRDHNYGLWWSKGGWNASNWVNSRWMDTGAVIPFT